jgi:hypothetical protein
MRNSFTIFLITLILTASVIVGHSNPNNTILKIKNLPSEQVYVHTDKDIYFAGDRVFFKIYLKTSSQPSFNLTSIIVYLSVNSGSGFPISTLELKLNNSSANGSFQLPDTLKAGVYSMQAWTNNILIAKSPAFHKQLLVINRFEDNLVKLINSIRPELDAANQLDLVRFQERLSNGFSWKQNDDGEFRLLFQGINDTKDTMQISLESKWLNISFLNPSQTKYKILISNLGHQVYSSFVDTSVSSEIDIDVFGLPQGYLTLRILNAEEKEVNTIRWLNRVESIVGIETSKDIYQSRELVEAFFNTSNLDGEIVSASLSVVRDESLTKNSTDINCLGHEFTNTSPFYNLKPHFTISNSGIIPFNFYNPGNIIMPTNQLDMVIMPENFGSIISGRVLSADYSQSISGARVLLSAVDRVTNLKYFQSLSDGSFFFLLDNYHMGKDLYLSVLSSQNDANFKIITRSKFWKSPFSIVPIITHPNIHRYIEEAIFIRKVNTGYNSELYQTIYFDKDPFNVNPPLLYGAPSHTLNISDYVEFDNFVELANEIVPNLRLKFENGEYSARVVNSASKSFFNEKPTFFLNGVNLVNLNQLVNFSSKNLDRIEIHSLPWVYGSIEFSGIISLFTKSSSATFFPEPNYSFLKGISVQDNILVNQPYYQKDNKMETVKPDYRETLVWEPQTENIISSAKYTFFTSDLKGDYTIVLEGITSKGTPFNSKHTFKVR